MQKVEKKSRKKVSISQKAIIYDAEKDKYLLAKVDASHEWYCANRGPWEFIGGCLDEGESISKSLPREITEEAGDIKFKVVDVVAIDEFEAPSGPKVVLIYLAKFLGGEVVLSEEHSEYGWVSAEDIEKGKEYKEWLKNAVKKAAKYIEREKSLDSWKRCQADFENYKKSQAKHQEEFRKYAKMSVIEQILPVVDNFEASLAHVPEEKKGNGWVEGITHIKRQIEDILKNNGVEEIIVKIGDKFDPALHEAVAGKGEKVKNVIQKGYKLNGRVLRAARVEVE